MAVHVGRWMLAFLIVTTVALLAAWPMQFPDEVKNLLDSFNTQQSGDIEIVFHIRSTNGDPLRRVGVLLTESRLGSAMGEDKETERFVVDSEFSLKKSGISAIHLSFFKDGFYDERWEYVMVQRPQDALGELFRIEVEISMIPLPSPAPLIKYEGSFRSDLDGPIAVLPTSTNTRSNRAAPPPESLGMARTTFPEPYVYLDAGVSGDGQLLSALFSMKRFPVPKPVLVKGALRIVGAKISDGFLPLDIGPIPTVFEHGFRNLSEAPQSGYLQALELFPVEGKEKMFFFCRIGGNFGKGALTNPPLIIESGGRNIAISNVVIFLNPTGSTDVSFLHH